MPARRAMTADEIAAFLDRREEWAVLTTLDADGTPHSVPLGYWRIGEAVYLGTPAGSRKARNAERDPRASVLVASAKATGAWDAVLLQGTVEVTAEPGARLEIEREGRRQRGTPDSELPTQPRRGEVMLKFTPQRVVSWRYD